MKIKIYFLKCFKLLFQAFNRKQRHLALPHLINKILAEIVFCFNFIFRPLILLLGIIYRIFLGWLYQRIMMFGINLRIINEIIIQYN